jgi:hypothetical protein
MGLGNQSTEQRFPFSADVVFEHLLTVLPAQKFTMKESDRLIRRITAAARLSLFSWGENISVSVAEDGPAACRVTIDSGLKLGTSWTGTHRNQKNIDTIIMALSKSLQAADAAPPTREWNPSTPEPVKGPRRVAGYNFKGLPIDEFEDGTYTLHDRDGPRDFTDKQSLNAHLTKR